MSNTETVLFEGDTDYEHYQVIDLTYGGREARLLFSGDHTAALSGIAFDDNHDLLFDYNQRFFELVAGRRPKRLLLIGGGVYTLPRALIHALSDIKIDVVELDDGLDKIATRYFGFKSDPRLNIIHGDGRVFLESNTRQYDMILVDAFMELDIPRPLSTIEAVQQIKRSLKSDGIVAINIVSPYHGFRAKPIVSHFAAYRQVFGEAEIYPADSSFSLWSSQNFLIVAQNGPPRPLHQLRFEAVPAIKVSRSDILRDE